MNTQPLLAALIICVLLAILLIDALFWARLLRGWVPLLRAGYARLKGVSIPDDRREQPPRE